MIELAPAVIILVISGSVAAIIPNRLNMAQMIGQFGAISGSTLGLVTAILILVTGETEAMSRIWYMPGGSLSRRAMAMLMLET